MSLLEYILHLSIVYLPWELFCLVVRILNLRYLQIYFIFLKSVEAVAQWLRCCATNRKFAGSIPTGIIGFFIDIKSFRSHHSPGVDSASNRSEYREYFLGVKAAGA